MTRDVIARWGWPNNLRLSNGDAEVVVTLDVGPRVLGYRLEGGANVLAELPDQLGKSGEPTWQARGGHRLWVSPEDLTRTYHPDNAPVNWLELGPGSVRLRPPAEAPHGLQKEIDLTLAPRGSVVSLVHRVTNVGTAPARLAPWALTVMAPGGVAIVPLPPKRPHPGPPSNARSAEEYAPNQALVLWPFSDFRDPRWGLGSRYVTLRQARRGPTKLGLAHTLGWVAYLNAGTLFVKRIGWETGREYPDRGCNFETFTNEEIIELEALGPIVTLPPGGTVELAEAWELHAGVPDVADEEAIDRHVRPLVK